jgi:hypothetical protein
MDWDSVKGGVFTELTSGDTVGFSTRTFLCEIR